MNRLELNYPVTREYTPEETEAAVQSINQTILPVLEKYELVMELRLDMADIPSFMNRLDSWPEVQRLFNLTRTLTFRGLAYGRDTCWMINSILSMHPHLKIVIEWLLVLQGVAGRPIVAPNRVYVQNVVFQGRDRDRMMGGSILFQRPRGSRDASH